MATTYRRDQFSQDSPDDVPEYHSPWDDPVETPVVVPTEKPCPVEPVTRALEVLVAKKAVEAVPAPKLPVVDPSEPVRSKRSVYDARYYAKHVERKRAKMREYQAGRRKLGTLARAGESPE